MRRGYPRGGSEDPGLHKTGGSVSLPLGTYITQHVPEEDMKERKTAYGYVSATFLLPVETHRRLKRAAQRMGVPMAQIVREAVERALKELERKEGKQEV